MSRNLKKRVSKADWLERSLEIFRVEGEPGVRIEAIARNLGVNKAGFYWHFKDRSDLLKQLLSYWEAEYTKVVTENTILRSLSPRDRILAVMNMIFDHRLAELDVHFIAWALKDRSVDKVVQRVIGLRLSYIQTAFLEAGFEREESEMRARLFVAFESNEGLMFRDRNKRKSKNYRERRCNLYLSGLEADPQTILDQ